MRDLLNPRGGLYGLMWETKFIYTLFLLFNLAGYFVMGALIYTRTGATHDKLTEYYRGNEDAFVYAVPDQELLNTTHFHLFGIPLMLFVQGHLFMLCGWPRPVKAFVVSAAFLGGALQVGAPWLVLKYSASYAPLITIGRVLLGSGFLIFTIVPLIALWRKPGPRVVS